jgi:hypothetical protein
VTALSFSVRDVRIAGVSVGRWAGLPDTIRSQGVATAMDLAQVEPGLFSVAAEYDLAEVRKAVMHAQQTAKSGGAACLRDFGLIYFTNV